MKKKETDLNRFVDRLNDRYNSEGIAELERVYLNVDNANEHKRDIVAKGITAFLGQENNFSFRHSLSNKGKRVEVSTNEFFNDKIYQNPNGGKGAIFYYELYYECRISRLQVQDNERESIPFDRKTKHELILGHLENEAQFFKESEQFFDELRSESDRPDIETIKKVALLYPKWVRETYLKEENQGEKSESSENQRQRSVKSPKTFPQFLIYDKEEELAKKLKEKFYTEKGIKIRYMLEALQAYEPKLLDIGHRECMAIYRALKLYFGRDIGAYNGIFNPDFKREDYPGIPNKDYETVKQEIDSILKTMNL
jgi:hypothetical protein